MLAKCSCWAAAPAGLSGLLLLLVDTAVARKGSREPQPNPKGGDADLTATVAAVVGGGVLALLLLVVLRRRRSEPSKIVVDGKFAVRALTSGKDDAPPRARTPSKSTLLPANAMQLVASLPASMETTRATLENERLGILADGAGLPPHLRLGLTLEACTRPPTPARPLRPCLRRSLPDPSSPPNNASGRARAHRLAATRCDRTRQRVEPPVR